MEGDVRIQEEIAFSNSLLRALCNEHGTLTHIELEFLETSRREYEGTAG